ncbi:MAG: CapA family protein [Spirochaetaceae bacterium]
MWRFINICILSLISFSLFSQEIVKLTFAGDLMAHDVNYKTEPLSDIYKGVTKELLADDLSFVNMEFPIDEDRVQSSYPSFNIHPKFIQEAITSGFDVFSLGNNHTNDFGYGSLMKTIKNMDDFKNREAIIYSGVYGKVPDLLEIESIQIGELHIGFIAITQFSNNFWNKEGAAKIYTVDYDDDKEANNLKTFIKSQEDKYDCLILSYHGGKEYAKYPSDKRKTFFLDLVDSGVDILWGHHPHVLQPWIHKSTDGGDKLIMFSMGNFISGQLAIVEPWEHNKNFSASGVSALFRAGLYMEDGKLRMDNVGPKITVNVRNENNSFVTVYKDDFLTYPMSENWKDFYTKIFPIAEHRIRKEDL